MKLFYIAPTEHCSCIQHDWHAIGLGNGHSLVCVRWRDELHEVEWSNYPGVHALPHPVFESTVSIGQTILQHLNARFPSLSAGSKVNDVVKLAAAEDAWMRLHAL